MPERRMNYSFGDGQKLHELSVMIAQLTNHHLHWDLKDEDPLIIASERGKAETEMEERLEGGALADWINTYL